MRLGTRIDKDRAPFFLKHKIQTQNTKTKRKKPKKTQQKTLHKQIIKQEAHNKKNTYSDKKRN